MTSKLSLSSAVSSATSLVAISSISAATVAADDKPNHHAAAVVAAAVATDDPLKDVSVEQDDITSAIDITALEERLFTPKSSTAAVKPDVGILSKDFLKNKGKEKQPVDKQFTIHRKKRAAAADVDVGILGNGRRQQKAFDANLHAMNKVTGRSLQYEGRLPWMCPDKNGNAGVFSYLSNLFNETDGYFPTCSCPSPTTCGPNLCECLELNADGDILQCMDSFNQLCEGTKYIDGIPGPWSMEQCLGGEYYGKLGIYYSKSGAIEYCSMLPCFVDGGSWWQCRCQSFDTFCTEFRDDRVCAMSKCCQAQTDDEGREACISFNGGYKNYYDQVTSFTISGEEAVSRFNECSFNSGDDKSIVECYCESFSYRLCVNLGVGYPDLCEANFCCDEQTEDDARLDCFSRFRNDVTGNGFDHFRDTIQDSCVASGKSSNQCKCDIHGLSNCVRGIGDPREPNCDLFQCCQSQTVDEGRNDCLVRDEARLVYETCINNGNSTETCLCDKSNTLCSSGHSNDRHCELSSCCQEQTDDTGRKECIGNFTTSQPPSSTPSTSSESSIILPEIEASSPAGDNVNTSSASTSCWFDATSHLVLATAVGIAWLFQ